MDILKNGIPAELFYGSKSASQVRIEAKLNKNVACSPIKKYPRFMTQLLGPSRTWRVFKKQQEAINFCNKRGNNLMCFAFEQKSGQRLFLVAHPKIFWAVNSHRFFKNCNTYEIIQEHLPCKLYFDIEFDYENNNYNHIGDRMLRNFLHVVNCNLHDSYGISCSMGDILNLDSSNEKKYSHHIIYQIPNVAFQNNYAVGEFVHRICGELKIAYGLNTSGYEEEMIRVAEKYQMKKEVVSEFFVHDSKGKVKLFVDEGVYTKNRHFRLLGSTKLDKNSPLVVCSSNEYKPKMVDSTNLNIFLDSLITYFSNGISRTLECNGSQKVARKLFSKAGKDPCYEKGKLCTDFEEIDNFILKLISPGSIRKKSFFRSTSRIIYDISGYRYCENIKRHHKSNNIMFVVDLNDFVYYQKCYDPDCAYFKSEMMKLPAEVCFILENDHEFINYTQGGNEENLIFEDIAEVFEINEKELGEILSCLEDMYSDSSF